VHESRVLRLRVKEVLSVGMLTNPRVEVSSEHDAYTPQYICIRAKAAMEDFRNGSIWSTRWGRVATGGDTDMENVILVGHYGSKHDHVYVMKNMMCW
jgi:hypothetical protein